MFEADVEVNVSLRDIRNAIFDGIDDSKELRRAYRDFVDDVEDTWKRIWDAMDHPYATGNYRAHIKKKMPRKYQRIKSFLKHGIPIGSVYNDSPVAHFVEYGTGPDNPDSRSPWGPNTPTPEMAPMRRTAARYGAKYGG